MPHPRVRSVCRLVTVLLLTCTKGLLAFDGLERDHQLSSSFASKSSSVRLRQRLTHKEACHTAACCDLKGISESEPETKVEENPKTGYAWSFAYGANMGHWKFDKMGIKPKVTLRAVLHDSCLRFNTPFGDNDDPTYANVEQVPGACVHGVAHLVTTSEMEQIDATEGGYVPTYLEAVSYGGQRLNVSVYVVPKPGSEKAPSSRYAEIVVCGAKENQLCHSYEQNLASHLSTLGIKESAIDCKDITLNKLPDQRSRGTRATATAAATFIPAASALLPGEFREVLSPEAKH